MKGVALLALILASTVVARGQGTIDFVNLAGFGQVNAPVYESDGVTKCSGPQFMAELLAGPSGNTLASIATVGFLTGAAAGYFNGGLQYVNSVAPGSTAWVQVEVWNTASGATFDQAKASGLSDSWWQSSVFSVVTGNPNPTPTPGALLTGLGNSPVYLNPVPEPSTLALLGLGTAFVLRKSWEGVGPTRRVERQ
jgi:hypothetical protein